VFFSILSLGEVKGFLAGVFVVVVEDEDLVEKYFRIGEVDLFIFEPSLKDSLMFKDMTIITFFFLFLIRKNYKLLIAKEYKKERDCIYFVKFVCSLCNE
jgi:hypothetical protein